MYTTSGVMSAQVGSSLLVSGSSFCSVPVEHLDYNFIQNCSDIKHLENILKVLRSGQEGFYPHLMDFCEKHMEKLDPKNRFLRKEKPAATSVCFSTEEWREISEELQQWETNIKMNEVKLNHSLILCDDVSVPAIRCFNTLEENIRTEVTSSVPRAYRDWDRFDVEKECAKIDKCETKPTKVFTSSNPYSIKHTINSTALTDQEKDFLARREKDKGNECFRSGDYEEAVVYYTRSLSVLCSATVYNNRAQTHIRLQHWSAALSDCQTVLQLQPENIKAMLRRATVHKHLGHLQESRDDLIAVLQKDPHNFTAQKLLMEVRGTTAESSRVGRKLFIQELDEDHKCKSPNTGRSYKIQTQTSAASETTEAPSPLRKEEAPETREMMRRSSSEPRRSISIIEVEDKDEESVGNCPSISLQPLNAFEFCQSLNAICGHGDLLTCAELLRNIPSERLPQYISTQLNGQTISFIIKTLNTYLRSQPHLLYEHLKHLHKAHRFSMVLMLLDSEDRRQLTEIFEYLSVVQTEAFTRNDVKCLANKYI